MRGMPILWGQKSTKHVPSCPSCQSAQVIETERSDSTIFYRCIDCWWPFVVLRPPIIRH